MDELSKMSSDFLGRKMTKLEIAEFMSTENTSHHLIEVLVAGE